MNHSIAGARHDVRPHPTARAGPPVSAAGCWWIGVTVLGVPLLLAALLVLPGLLLADRLPSGAGDNAIIFAAVWAPVAAVAFGLVLRTQFRRVAGAPAAHWGWVVPAVYMVAASVAGPNLARILLSVDQTERANPDWNEIVIYGSMILGIIVGSLLAQRVVGHLPRAPVPRARAAWVEAVPVMSTLIVGYNLVLLALVVGFMTWVDGSLWFGPALAVWVFAVFIWTISVRVALTPSGVRLTQGPFGLVATTRIMPLADIASIEVVEVSTLQVMKALGCGNLKFCAFRPGPALRVHLHAGPTVTIGMHTRAQARHAADLLTTWQLEQTAV